MTEDAHWIAPGELRADLLELFAPQAGTRVLMTAPGDVPRRFSGAVRLARHPHQLPGPLAGRWLEAALASFGEQVDRARQSPAELERIRGWAAGLSDGVQVRFYSGAPIFTRLILGPTDGVAPMGPLTVARAQGERDLALRIEGATLAQARRWFEGLWSEAEDVSGEVRSLLASSWAGEAIDPETLYLFVLSRYFASTLEGLGLDVDDNPMLEQLTEFQVDAYHHAKGILRRFGGVFLSDVVGLGKTYIALALLKFLQDRHGEHAVVIAPPAVCRTWEEAAKEHRVELQTLSIGKLDRLDEIDREVLVIDESHNFRNRGTLRAGRVNEWLRPGGQPSSRRVVLLSATPQNNDPRDVLQQIRFFPDDRAPLPHRGESLDAWFDEVRKGRANLSDVLQHIVVRRTRKFIQAQYPDATLRVRTGPGRYRRIPLAFPTRRAGPDQTLRYRLSRDGRDLYGALMEQLGAMQYPTHAYALYVREERKGAPEVANLMQTGASMRGLYKVTLLKRLESSLHAFSLSLSRLRARLGEARARFAAGVVRVRVRVDPADLPEEDASGGSEEVDLTLSWFDRERLRRDLDGDVAKLDRMAALVDALLPVDPKLERLRVALAQRPPTEHSTIVFTQFADTAEYLGAALAEGPWRMATVTGQTRNVFGVARRFAPRSQRAEIDEAERLHLLVSTDVLSEGVNLQDADTLVNYDLHWNPVRLIQRAGRIDRIGSVHDEIQVASFLPEQGLEENLGLEEVLRARIADFIAVFGEDWEVLPASERIEEPEVIKAYTGEALEEADREDETDALSRHRERLLHLRRRDPERYANVVAMRPGRRAFSNAAGRGVAIHRLDWLWAFWACKADGLTRLADQQGLDLLWAHARAGSAPESEAGHALASAWVEATRGEFGSEAQNLREQRRHPRLHALDAWLLARLRTYLEEAEAVDAEAVRRVEGWVRSGHARVQLHRDARRWRQEDLAPTSVFYELLAWSRRFPAPPDVLGEEEVVGVAVGSSACSSSTLDSP